MEPKKLSARRKASVPELDLMSARRVPDYCMDSRKFDLCGMAASGKRSHRANHPAFLQRPSPADFPSMSGQTALPSSKSSEMSG